MRVRIGIQYIRGAGDGQVRAERSVFYWVAGTAAEGLDVISRSKPEASATIGACAVQHGN